MLSEKIKIENIASHRIKRFEKEIRRHIKRFPECQFDHNGIVITSATYHLYCFKRIMDLMYQNKDEHEFPFMEILIYSNIYTNRSFKTDEYIPKSESDIESIDYIIDNHDCLILYVYDEKFPYKPEKSYLEIFCTINKKKRAIIPMQFSRNLSYDYPEWFEGKLEKHVKPEVGIDFDLIERIQLALS